MCSNERFLTMGALCAFLASPSVALGQSAQARLAKAKSLKCVFQIVASASWTNGEPRGEIKPTKLSFAFDEIDSDEGYGADHWSVRPIGNHRTPEHR